MIRRGVKVQLLVFGLLAIVIVLYTGTAYLGFGNLVYPPMKVTMYLDQSGGIFTNASVTERGVTVGKVGKMSLTPNGLAVQLIIDHGQQIPANTDAVVANLSFVGEQYVDLQPATSGGPYLKDGSTIPATRTKTPIADADFLTAVDKLVDSVNKDDLRTVVDELGKAFQDGGGSLQTLIDKGSDLTAALKADLPNTLDLINRSQTVLGTVADTSGQLQDFTKNLASITDTLRSSDPDLRTLLTNGTDASEQLSDVLASTKQSLPLLLANVATLSDIVRLRIPGLKQALILYPEVVRNGTYALPGNGTTRFGLVVDETVGVCTKGYEGTTRRSGSDTSPATANTNAACTEPTNSPIDVRGSRNAPRPAGDNTDPALGGTLSDAAGGGSNVSLTAPGAAGSSSALPAGLSSDDDAEKIQLAGYDPTSGLVSTPDGKDVVLAPTNGSAPLFGKDGWKWILVGSTASQG